MATITVKIDKALIDYIAGKKDRWVEDAIKAGIAESAADIAEEIGVMRSRKTRRDMNGNLNHG